MESMIELVVISAIVVKVLMLVRYNSIISHGKHGSCIYFWNLLFCFAKGA